MIKISKHLSFDECTRSETATKMGIVNNNPNLSVIENMKALAENVFEPLRVHFNVSIHVSSVFRSMNLNQAIKGSITSQHCSGQAMDIDNGDKGKPINKEIFDYIKKNIKFDQLIWEMGDDKNPSWVHVSYSKEKNRGQVLKAKKLNGKVHYENFK